MIKLNITLPSGAQVSIESDDKDLVREVYYSAMHHLDGAPHQTNGEVKAAPPEPENHHNGANSNGHAAPPAQPANGTEPAGDPAPAATNGNHLPSPALSTTAVIDRPPAPVEPPPQPAQAQPVRAPVFTPSTPDEHEFIAFCQRVNPLGDMRRVVVAAEAADRHLGIASVDPDELARLFTLAGWTIPHSFVQTLRNSARTKFRWLARIPGQPGHYRVTDTGRSIVLGENSPPRRDSESEPEGDQ